MRGNIGPGEHSYAPVFGILEKKFTCVRMEFSFYEVIDIDFAFYLYIFLLGVLRGGVGGIEQ